MNPGLLFYAFLVGCSTTLTLGGELEPLRRSPIGRLFEQPVMVDSKDDDILLKRYDALHFSEEWLSKQSTDLLDIIKILYKGREAEVKELEAAQATMEPKVQMEHRIALIKATLSEKTAK
jgi:hypothetical protein